MEKAWNYTGKPAGNMKEDEWCCGRRICGRGGSWPGRGPIRFQVARTDHHNTAHAQLITATAASARLSHPLPSALPSLARPRSFNTLPCPATSSKKERLQSSARAQSVRTLLHTTSCFPCLSTFLTSRRCKHRQILTRRPIY